MKKILLALLLGSSSISFAQQSTELGSGGCGTITSPQQLQEVYDFVQHNPLAYHKGTGTVDTIPLTVHIVGDDAGNGYYPVASLFKVICQLNERFAPVNFYFYIKWPLTYINNTSYYTHNFASGGDMMDNNNVSNTVNVYFVNDPAGNCGYYTYGEDAVAIKKDCAGNNSTTLTHELGHFFSLPHTFSGWENNNVPSNPEAIRRTGTGTNCNTAGDGFCDTWADYYGDRWSCPMVTTKRDQFGDLYHLDSSMYMSYSSDVCQSRFSTQQIAKMQNNLHTAGNRSGIFNAIPPAHSAIDTGRVIYPVDTMYNNLKKVVWNRMPGADHYYVRVSFATSTVLTKQIIFTSDTSVDLTFSQIDGVQYQVTINPVNGFDVCMGKTKTINYTYSQNNGQVGVTTINYADNELILYPNPLSNGSQLNIKGLNPDNYDIIITSTSGAVVYKNTINSLNSTDVNSIALPTLAPGLYFVKCNSTRLQLTQKLIISQ